MFLTNAVGIYSLLIFECSYLLKSSWIYVVFCSLQKSENFSGTLFLVGVIEKWDLLSVYNVKGCSELPCAAAVHQLTPGDVLFYHEHFSKRDHLQQKQWVLEFMSSNCSRQERVFSFIVCGKTVCLDVWLRVLGISSTKFSKIKADFLKGKVSVQKPTPTRKPKLSTCQAVAWMGNYFERYMNILIYLIDNSV